MGADAGGQMGVGRVVPDKRIALRRDEERHADLLSGGGIVPVLAVDHPPAQVQWPPALLILAHAIVMLVRRGAEIDADLPCRLAGDLMRRHLPAQHRHQRLPRRIAQLQADRRQQRREIAIRGRCRMGRRRGIHVQRQRRRGKAFPRGIGAVAQGRAVGILWQDAIAGGLQRLGLAGGDGHMDDIGPIGLDIHPRALAIEQRRLRGSGRCRQNGGARQCQKRGLKGTGHAHVDRPLMWGVNQRAGPKPARNA